MNDDEKIARAVENSVQGYNGNLEEAVKAGKAMVEGDDTKETSKTFYEAASVIVEPLEAEDSYYDWMDNKPDSWSGFIANNHGSNWGQIAKIVNQYGY